MFAKGQRTAIVATAAFGLQAALLGLLHLLPTGYDPWVNFVSEYAVGELAFWMAASQVAGVVGAGALAAALFTRGFGWLVLGLLSVHVMARVLGAVFPVDPIEQAFTGGGPPEFTTAGWIHAVSGMVGAITLLAFMALVTVHLFRARELASPYWPLLPLCLLAPIGYAAMLATRPATFPAGLFQRIFLVSALAWLLTLTIGLARGRLAPQGMSNPES